MKKKIAFLFDKKNTWIKKYINHNSFSFSKKKYAFNFFTNKNKVKKFDVVFVLGYTQKLNNKFLKNNILALLVHESNLPYGRGSAPMQWQILKNKKKIYICLIIVDKKLDCGDIILRDQMVFKGDELNDEIRDKQAKYTLKIINNFLKKYPKFVRKRQKGLPSYFRKRNKLDSKLDINKTLKKQFNLLRVCDNENYPAYFVYKSNKYKLKIYKDKNYEKDR
tara:strand:+ start:4187 stop:4849 length:663 start_codon:yes stop_codon:yes gene_type:complete